MSVRWKPLTVLSALFLLIAAGGLIAFAVLPGDSRDEVKKAHEEWEAGKFDRALIHFQRGLQKDPKNAGVHEELAEMFGRWSEAVPSRRGELRAKRLHELAEAARFDKRGRKPRRLLLVDALRHEEAAEGRRWARELIALDPKDPDAHFALASEAVAAQPPRTDEADEHLKALAKAEPSRVRTLWLKAAVAQQRRDEKALAGAIDAGRAAKPGDDPVDQLAGLRLRLIELDGSPAPDALSACVGAIGSGARRLAGEGEPAPNRIATLGRLLDQAHTKLVAVGPEATDLLGKLDQDIEAIYQKATEPSASPDPKTFQAYAEHLLRRNRRAECLDVVAKGLALPASGRAAWNAVAMGLRELGIKAALLDPKDPERYARAEPYVKAMAVASEPLYSGIGHLFRGVIDMERSGMAEPPSAGPGAPPKADPKLKASALKNLKVAAANLPRVPTAQALYGVALMLSKEPTLGRQYLHDALRLGGLEPRYQVWVAWSLIQGEYAEEAAPIVAQLRTLVDEGKLPAEFGPMLHLLQGEIYQARRTPEDLRKARAEYAKAAVPGQEPSAALQVRVAQLDFLLGDRAMGERRLSALRKAGSGPAAEALAVIALKEQKKPEEAARALAEARGRYPDSDELVNLDAVLRIEQGQPEEADTILADFLAQYPDHLDARLNRARLLAGPLKSPEKARAVLAEAADGDNSAPLVQMAMLDIEGKDFDRAAATIARIRARWKEAAAADLLDAQLALAQDDPRGALARLDDALAKDPANKVALFWKAQLAEKAGAGAEAARVFETIAREPSSKEVADGLSLAQAARWSLASLALEERRVDEAISTYEQLLKSNVGPEASRQLRWQLAMALAAKGRAPEAKAAIGELLASPKTTALERVQAANFYRAQGDRKAAREQVDRVLKAEPANPQAVATSALLLADEGKPDQAAAGLRRAIAAGKQPPSIYLMLAAAENLKGGDGGPGRVVSALDEGLAAYPGSVELVWAKYLALKLGKDPGALAYVESAARGSKDGALRRLLIDAYREEGELARAERVARDLLKGSPKDARLAETLVGLVAGQAVQAARQGDAARAKSLEDEARTLIRGYRKDFPQDIAFVRADCEMAARRGDLGRAESLTREIDKLAPNSPVGPVLRAQIHAARGVPADAARDYAEAVGRSPKQLDLRLLLGQASLEAGRADEAITQADYVLAAQPAQPAAVLMKARALASQAEPADGREARLDEAVKLLRGAIAADAKTPAYYHLIAEVERSRGRRDKAVAVLKEGREAVPDDTAGLGLLVQYLSDPTGPDRPTDLDQARAIADRAGADDPTGSNALALAVGFHKAGQEDLAQHWIERASARLDAPAVHLTFGDILLARGEADPSSASAREVFRRALAEYDRVLAAQADSIEAINNKAWILHRYLEDHEAALQVAEGLSRRADPSTLPPEFLDTLGSIQESLQKRREAEDSYARGLTKAPGFPMLNYHMARLLAADRDRSRAARALPYLEKARSEIASLPDDAAAEVEALWRKLASR